MKRGRKKYSNQMKWRHRQMDNLMCGYCGEPNTTMRVGCDNCTKLNNKRAIYRRHFMRDFT